MSLNKLISVRLVLENCESIEIPIDRISTFDFNIKQKDYYFANSDSVYSSLRSDHFYIRIKNLETLMYKSFGDKEESSALERLKKCPDITHIEIKYEDGIDGDLNVPIIKELYVCVPWGGNYNMSNLYQKLSQHRRLVIPGTDIVIGRYDNGINDGMYQIEIKERIYWPSFMYNLYWKIKRLLRLK